MKKRKIQFSIISLFAFVAVPLMAEVEIKWESPEELRDFKISIHDEDDELEFLIKTFEGFASELLERSFPSELKMTVTIKDIDMAGDFEFLPDPNFNEIRLVDSSLPASLKLSYILTDSTGKELLSGDFNRQHSHFPPDLLDRRERFPYVRSLFRDWAQDTRKAFEKKN